jgi:hypothetical protein
MASRSSSTRQVASVNSSAPAFYFGVRPSPNGLHAEIVTPSPVLKSERRTLTGKKLATPRPIGIEMDEIDLKIIELKEQNMSNKEIAERIKELGIEYDPKTIGTRYLRLKAVNASRDKKGEDASSLREWTPEEAS